MPKGRLEAFSDGVIAILITIMVPSLSSALAHDRVPVQRPVDQRPSA